MLFAFGSHVTAGRERRALDAPQTMIRIGVEDHPHRESERAGWQRAAHGYMSSFEAATGLFAPALLDAAEVRGDTNLLDVACA